MQLTEQIREHMAEKGYVYWQHRDYPAKNGMRQQCRNLKDVDRKHLIFDTPAYEAHIKNGHIKAHNAA